MISAISPHPGALDLWRALRHYIAQICETIGMPAHLAQRVWLARWEYKNLSELLRPLEMLLRRLIFLEAAALTLAPEPPRPETKNNTLLMRARSGACFDPERSETWRVRFNLAINSARTPKRSSCLSLSKTSSATLVSSAPLALRLEALIRGFNDPAPLARRLARILRRLPKLARVFSAPLSKRDASRPFFHSVEEAGARIKARDTS